MTVAAVNSTANNCLQPTVTGGVGGACKVAQPTIVRCSFRYLNASMHVRGEKKDGNSAKDS
jgi:hypothetical protein